MEYAIAVAAAVWMAPFLVLEYRRGGRAGYLSRVIGNVPFIVLAILVLVHRFNADAFIIDIYFVVIVSVIGLVFEERKKRRGQRQASGG